MKSIKLPSKGNTYGRQQRTVENRSPSSVFVSITSVAAMSSFRAAAARSPKGSLRGGASMAELGPALHGAAVEPGRGPRAGGAGVPTFAVPPWMSSSLAERAVRADEAGQPPPSLSNPSPHIISIKILRSTIEHDRS